MGKTIDRHEMIADYLDEMETRRRRPARAGDARRLPRGAGAQAGSCSAASPPPARRIAERPGRARRAAHRTAARRATPLLKYLAAEKAVEMARRCLQIHGGNGYMKRVRRREAAARRAGDADLRGHQPDPGADGDEGHAGRRSSSAPQAFVKRVGPGPLAGAVGARRARAAGGRAAAAVAGGAAAPGHPHRAPPRCKARQRPAAAEWPQALLQADWNPKRDFRLAMLHAERLTRLLADELIAEVLLEQAQKHPERRAAAGALPRARRAARALPARRDHHAPARACWPSWPARRGRGGRGGDGGAAPTAAAPSARSAGRRRGRRVAPMALPARHLRHQGRVLAALGGTALEAGLRAAGAGRAARRRRRPARPGDRRRGACRRRRRWCATTCASWAAIPAAYRGRLPPHLFPQWGFPLAARTLRGLPYPLLRVMNGGCRLRDERARCRRASRCRCARGWRASTTTAGARCCTSAWSPGPRRCPRRVVADICSRSCPLAGRGSTARRRRRRRRPQGSRARVPDDAREMAFWRLRPDAGLDFAMLTGDFNPIHWVRPYARALGLPQRHPARLRHPGAGHRGAEPRRCSPATSTGWRCIDVRFTRPLVLPARVGLYVRRADDLTVGDAPGRAGVS